MLHYIGKRLLQLIPVLLGMTFIVFMIIRAIPGDPAQVILGQLASKEAIEALRLNLGLDNPWYIQYFNYLSRTLKRRFRGINANSATGCGRDLAIFSSNI